MNTNRFQSPEEIYELQIEHLRAQYEHLKFMQKYHSWMMNEVAEPRVSQLHGTIIDKVNDALKDLNKLIETLQPASLSDIHSFHSASD